MDSKSVPSNPGLIISTSPFAWSNPLTPGALAPRLSVALFYFMSETPLDDTDSKISYSSGWDIQRGDSRQYLSTAHSSKNNNAKATLKWRGTGARIYGTMPVGSGEVRWRWTLNGVSRDESRHTHTIAYYDDVMADTGNLQEGLHTLVIEPLDTQEPLILDRWVVWLRGEQPWDVSPPTPPPTTTTTPSPGTTVRQQVGQGTTTTNILTTTETHTQHTSNTSQQTSITSPSISGSTTTSAPSNSETSQTSRTNSDMTERLTSLSTSVFTTTDANGNTQVSTAVVPVMTEFVSTPGTTSTNNGLPLGAIIGLAIGGAIIVLLFILVLLLWRRRNSTKQVSQATPESPPETSERSTNWFQRQAGRVNGVTPFELTQVTTARAATTFPISSPPTKGGRAFVRLHDDDAGPSTAPAENLSVHNSGSSEPQSSLSLSPRDEKRKIPPSTNSSTLSPRSERATFGRDTLDSSSQTDVFRDPVHPTTLTPVTDVDDAPPAYPGPRMSMVSRH